MRSIKQINSAALCHKCFFLPCFAVIDRGSEINQLLSLMYNEGSTTGSVSTVEICEAALNTHEQARSGDKANYGF
jgi:alkaline phosphatase